MHKICLYRGSNLFCILIWINKDSSFFFIWQYGRGRMNRVSKRKKKVFRLLSVRNIENGSGKPILELVGKKGLKDILFP